MSNPSSRKPSLAASQSSRSAKQGQSVRSDASSRAPSRTGSLKSVHTMSDSAGKPKRASLRHCGGRNPPLQRSWSQVSNGGQGSGSRRGSQCSDASSRTASSIVSETDDEDACVRRIVYLDRHNKMDLVTMKSKNNRNESSPADVLIDFSGNIDEMELDQMPWMKEALRKPGPNGRRGSAVLATSHVHKHRPKNSSGGGSRREASKSSVLAESDTNTLFFCPDAARAGKEGLSLVTQEEQIRRDPRTKQLYFSAPGSETIQFRSSKLLKEALLAVPDASETLRMAATRHRNFGAPKPTKE